MLELNRIRENKEAVIEGLLKKNFTNAKEIIGKLLLKDDLRKEAQFSLDEHLASANQYSKEIGQLMKAGKKDEAEVAKAASKALREKSHHVKELLKSVEDEVTEILYMIPNVARDSVPEGSSEKDNQTIYEYHVEVNIPENALPHWELIKNYDIIDFELGNKITGAGFPIYKNAGAKIQRALINYFLNKAGDSGYSEIQPPILVNEDSAKATGQLPDKDGQMYHATEDNLYLVPTAEIPVTNIFRNSILKEDDLPVKVTAYSPCFRREAGSWGAHVRGLNRLHQFDKVEIVQVQHPEKSDESLEEMKDHISNLLKELNLPYRILNLCGGDLGFTAAVTYDFEVYSAAQKQWLEVSSVSNFETYQANRLKLRYKDKNKKSHFLHTLNGSALALPRILAAILENNQTEDGIRIPSVLVPYMGIDMITK
jgi:seryl-tRNA synthetase